MLTLIPLSVLFGIGILVVFRRLSSQRRIRDSKRMIAASLYELRLYADEPALLWKAQLTLLRYNFLYLSLTLVPALVISIPGLLLFGALDALYGLTPLPIGNSAIVTAHLREPIDMSAPAPELRTPEGFLLEAPGVRVIAEHEISWRVRPLRAGDGVLRLSFSNGAVEKRIQAGADAPYVSQRRVRTWWDLLRYPAEPRLSLSQLAWIEVRYPRADLTWLGFQLPWFVWLLIFSGATVMVFKQRFGVTL